MTFDDFKRNLRGVNDNADFSVEFLVGPFYLEVDVTDYE